MSNVISFSERRSKAGSKFVREIDGIDGALVLLQSHFISDSDLARMKTTFIKSVKGILRSRSVKYRVQLSDLPLCLGKNTTLLFASKKIGFSLDVKSKLLLENGWLILPLDPALDPVENVGMIINKLDEVK
ncbi:hypothetical protein NRB14_16985 [Pseudomonas viridiflava]|uniref:hypothetical protein n=1 Tax=Pseudomonas viridiflava TaxID=33069 RepID=UPI00211D37C2|nr:hypothetical protein [Pseudomonas viridiflava]MCQ9393297.1 hypothetical protein [Pseudomonas viridiflava]